MQFKNSLVNGVALGIFSTTLFCLVAPPKTKAMLTDCVEIEKPFNTPYNTNYLVCQDMGSRWLVQCDQFNRNCLKVCNIDGYYGKRCR